jgi:hypothetical protein
MNCTWNLLPKAVSQTPRDRPLSFRRTGILKSDIFSEKTVQNLGGLYGSGRSPSLIRTDLRTKCSAGKIWQSTSAASRSSKSLVLRAATANEPEHRGFESLADYFMRVRAISTVYKFKFDTLLLRFRHSPVPEGGRGPVGICVGLATQSNREYPRVLHPPARFERRTRYVCVGLYE